MIKTNITCINYILLLIKISFQSFFFKFNFFYFIFDHIVIILLRKLTPSNKISEIPFISFPNISKHPTFKE